MSWVAVYFALVSAVQSGHPCSTPAEPVVDAVSVQALWSLDKKRAALKSLEVQPGWGEPGLFGGNVNNLAWQDSANLAWDGKSLAFMEASLDPVGWNEFGAGSPETLPDFLRGPSRGREPSWGAQFYISSFENGNGCAVRLFPFANDSLWQWGGQQASDGTWTYVGYQPETRYNPDLYQDGQSWPLNTELVEDDPHFVSETGELFFWSAEFPGGDGTETIWLSEKTGPRSLGWNPPVPLTAPINLPDSDQRQPHLTPEGWLYYASSENGNGLEIFRAVRLGPNVWGFKEKILGLPDALPQLEVVVAAIGEPSVAADGTMAFVVVFYNTLAESFDADIALLQVSRQLPVNCIQ